MGTHRYGGVGLDEPIHQVEHEIGIGTQGLLGGGQCRGGGGLLGVGAGDEVEFVAEKVRVWVAVPKSGSPQKWQSGSV